MGRIREVRRHSAVVIRYCFMMIFLNFGYNRGHRAAGKAAWRQGGTIRGNQQKGGARARRRKYGAVSGSAAFSGV